MELEDVSVGSIFSFPDKPVESVDIVCKSKSCCNGTPLHPDAYRHPVVILDCDNNSVDVLKITSTKPDERFACHYLKIHGPRTHLSLSEHNVLILEKGAMHHDSYVNMQHSYNLPISSLKVFRTSGPKLSVQSLQVLKRYHHNIERPTRFRHARTISDNQANTIRHRATNNSDDSGDTQIFYSSPNVKTVRQSIDGASIRRREDGWTAKRDSWGRMPRRLKHWTKLKFRMAGEKTRNHLSPKLT